MRKRLVEMTEDMYDAVCATLTAYENGNQTVMNDWTYGLFVGVANAYAEGSEIE